MSACHFKKHDENRNPRKGWQNPRLSYLTSNFMSWCVFFYALWVGLFFFSIKKIFLWLTFYPCVYNVSMYICAIHICVCTHTHVMVGMWKSENNLGYLSSPCLRQGLLLLLFYSAMYTRPAGSWALEVPFVSPFHLPMGHEDYKCVSWVLYGLWDYTCVFYFCVANISHMEPSPHL